MSTTPKTAKLPDNDLKPVPYRGPSGDEVLALTQEYLNLGIITYIPQSHQYCGW